VGGVKALCNMLGDALRALLDPRLKRRLIIRGS
jgi:hypothetical protein